MLWIGFQSVFTGFRSLKLNKHSSSISSYQFLQLFKLNPDVYCVLLGFTNSSSWFYLIWLGYYHIYMLT